MDTLPLQLDACCGREMSLAANANVAHNLGIRAQPSSLALTGPAGCCWSSHADILPRPSARESLQNCRFYAILLCGPNAQASRGKVDLDEKRDVGARDENHRTDEQQRNRPRKT
jgi:hypothetical protein